MSSALAVDPAKAMINNTKAKTASFFIMPSYQRVLKLVAHSVSDQGFHLRHPYGWRF
jgi:hypothetical protein